MAMGDHTLVPVWVPGGTRLAAGVAAVEPVADLAALCPADNQALPDEAEAFEAFTEATEAVPLCATVPAFEVSLRAHVLTHEGQWVAAEVAQYGIAWEAPGATLFLSAPEQIKCGTSGGPVINDAGELFGVISYTSESDKGGP
jgi:hypothetical protein